jgi:hypothetical protein
VAVVEDETITGAKLVVPASSGVVAGAHAIVEADGHEGTVEIRWVHEHPQDPTRVRVGVEFRNLSPQLESRIFDLVAEERKETVDWRWNVAR